MAGAHGGSVARSTGGFWELEQYLPAFPTVGEGVCFDAILADKAFDIDWIRAELDERGASAVIPSKADRKQPTPCDTAMYRWRHLVENYFAKIKEFQGIATRYDKTDSSYEANWHLAAAIIAGR